MAENFRDCKVEYSTDGTTWNDISGDANEISVDGGELASASAHVFSQRHPFVVVGKPDPLQVKVKVLYREESGSAWQQLRAAYEAEPPSGVYLRWSPRGGSSGDLLYTTDPGFITTPPYPGGSADSPDPVAIEFTLVTPKITISTIT